MKIFDSHAHLQDSRISCYCTGILERAAGSGVCRILCCGSNEEDWGEVAGLYEKYPDYIIPAFGIHPLYVHTLSDHWFKKLNELLDNYPCAAVGEIGLDGEKKDRDYQRQRDIFRMQMNSAVLHNRPVSLHCRNAWLDLQRIVLESGVPACGGAVHSWSGSAEMVQIMIKNNLSISFSGAITNEKNKKGVRALLQVPAEKLLVESDTPDLPPSQKKFPNEPSYINETIKKIAELRMVTDVEIARQTFENACRIFCKHNNKL